jgi:hypothetical protein
MAELSESVVRTDAGQRAQQARIRRVRLVGRGSSATPGGVELLEGGSEAVELDDEAANDLRPRAGGFLTFGPSGEPPRPRSFSNLSSDPSEEARQ